jgi:endonuclease/exonuclease/phosphatase family metal-dependent hydrolase
VKLSGSAQGSAQPGTCAVEQLTPIEVAERGRLLKLAREGIAHDHAADAIAVLNEILLGHFQVGSALPERLRVGAWNAQQCHWASDSARLLGRQNLDLVLLSELDIGMRRTGQLNTPEHLARALDKGFGFAVEFVELTANGGSGDRDGLHGNGFLVGPTPRQVKLVRLGSEADWFNQPRRNQHRVGGRVALMAAFAWGATELIAVSVHLESDANEAGRARQMTELLSAVDGFAAGRPVLIGGDFNTGARHPTLEFRTESLFAVAESFGFDWIACNARGSTTRVSRVANALPQDRAHYDWFFTRQLVASDPEIVPAVDAAGRALSDHELITLTISSAR